MLLDVAPEPRFCSFFEDNSALILLMVSVVVLAACGFFIYRYKKSHWEDDFFGVAGGLAAPFHWNRRASSYSQYPAAWFSVRGAICSKCLLGMVSNGVKLQHERHKQSFLRTEHCKRMDVIICFAFFTEERLHISEIVGKSLRKRFDKINTGVGFGKFVVHFFYLTKIHLPPIYLNIVWR